MSKQVMVYNQRFYHSLWHSNELMYGRREILTPTASTFWLIHLKLNVCKRPCDVPKLDKIGITMWVVQEHRECVRMWW